MGYARRNFLVPIPSFESFDALNAYLGERCLERLGRRLRGRRDIRTRGVDGQDKCPAKPESTEGGRGVSVLEWQGVLLRFWDNGFATKNRPQKRSTQ